MDWVSLGFRIAGILLPIIQQVIGQLIAGAQTRGVSASPTDAELEDAVFEALKTKLGK